MVPAVKQIKTLGYASIYIYIYIHTHTHTHTHTHIEQNPQTLQRLKTLDKGVSLKKKRSQERTAFRSVPTYLRGGGISQCVCQTKGRLI